MKLEICVATMRQEQAGAYPGDISLATANATTQPVVNVLFNTPKHNLGVVGSYQWLYKTAAAGSDLLCFMHDDVIVRERGWDARVIREFEDETVGMVGFGGAKQHGAGDLYKTPYRLQQLGRSGYLSNVDDAEVHGARFEGATDVAVLDGYVLVIRRRLLDLVGGWQQVIDAGVDFIGYDYMMCGLVHRVGARIRVVGVRCHHRGGGTSVAVVKADRQAEYEHSHRWLYDNMRDVLPWVCR